MKNTPFDHCRVQAGTTQREIAARWNTDYNDVYEWRSKMPDCFETVQIPMLDITMKQDDWEELLRRYDDWQQFLRDPKCRQAWDEYRMWRTLKI